MMKKEKKIHPNKCGFFVLYLLRQINNPRAFVSEIVIQTYNIVTTRI